MNVQILESADDLTLYDTWLKQRGVGNLWQSLERKQYCEALGKEVRIYALVENEQIRASALVVIDSTTGGYSTWEIPRGPLGEGRTEVLDRIIADAKREKCLAVYLCPPKPFMTDHQPLRASKRHVHCEATRIIDLTQSEEEILSQMHQKGRYNIKVAQKHGVTVTESQDIDTFHALVKQTSKRDGFSSLSKAKYQAFLDHLPGSFLLMATDESGKPIAGVLSVIWGSRAIYYYGASNHAERAKMAPYLLQWESMRLCKEKGCLEYDLLGIAPSNAPSDHPWAGISTFKEKFGGEVVTYPAEQVVVLRPLAYHRLQLKRKILG